MNDKNLRHAISSLKNMKQMGGVDATTIKAAEDTLNLKFADDYIEYLETFGQIEASGIELTGLSKRKSTSVIELTIRERKLGVIPEGFYVIEDLGIDGIIYAQSYKGPIVELAPHQHPVEFAKSLQEYVVKSQQ